MTRARHWVLTDVVGDVWLDQFGVSNETLRLATRQPGHPERRVGPSCFAVLRALVLGLPVVTTRRRRVVRGSWRVKRKASTVLISPW